MSQVWCYQENTFLAGPRCHDACERRRTAIKARFHRRLGRLVKGLNALAAKEA